MGRQVTLCPVGIVRRFTLRTGVLRLDAYLMLGLENERKEDHIAIQRLERGVREPWGIPHVLRRVEHASPRSRWQEHTLV